MVNRTELALSGLVGLAAAGLATGLTILIVRQPWMPQVITRPVWVWTLFLMLGGISAAEIPVMVYGMRRMAARPGRSVRYLLWLTNGFYVFFAAVYAAPYILLTSRPGTGAVLAGLSLIRFISSLLFLPGAQNTQSTLRNEDQ
ncbi:MAG: hypothetical protein D6784_10075 [Chloroflexi bacterium]|nr:MAG: hypothetical protein D6784_10075 [Chloroflexota bacterium]